MIDVEVWVRGRQGAATERLSNVNQDSASWTESHVKVLLESMLLALHRVNDPDGEPPPITLRGFSWIVSPADGGVLVHVEMQLGTVSAGPFPMDETLLSDMIARAIGGPKMSTLVH